MWRICREKRDAGTECWHLLNNAGEELSFGQVFLHWRVNEKFRAFWSNSLREVPFDSYCWECPPVTTQSSARSFECVFVSSPLLDEMPPDPEPFAEYFHPECSFVTFESLGRDALLVAPCPAAQGGNFAHLARFIASATDAQISALWRGVGEALDGRIDSDPTWLSTAGLGVSWLHVRLDTRPKYYRHAPYKVFNACGTGA